MVTLVEQRDQCGDHAGEKEIECERFQTTSDDARQMGGLLSDSAMLRMRQMRLQNYPQKRLAREK